MPIVGFELMISGVGGDSFTSCATTTNLSTDYLDSLTEEMKSFIRQNTQVERTFTTLAIAPAA